MCRPIPREITTPIQFPAISKAVATISLPRSSSLKSIDTASTSSTSSSASSTKRVSFHETVDVQVIDRLDAFAVRELFYQPVDFRHFRYEVCIEKLEARAQLDPSPSIFQSIISSLSFQRQSQTVPSSSASTTEMRKALGTPSPESLVRELAFVL